MKIQDTELPTATKNILSRCHIYTIDNLANCSIDRLYRIHGLGSKRINEIIAYLIDEGLWK